MVEQRVESPGLAQAEEPSAPDARRNGVGRPASLAGAGGLDSALAAADAFRAALGNRPRRVNPAAGGPLAAEREVPLTAEVADKVRKKRGKRTADPQGQGTAERATAVAGRTRVLRRLRQDIAAPPGEEEEDSRELAYAFGLRKIRLARALTQEELGDKAGLDQLTISRLENFRHPPQASTLAALSDVLNVDPVDILSPTPVIPRLQERKRVRRSLGVRGRPGQRNSPAFARFQAPDGVTPPGVERDPEGDDDDLSRDLGTREAHRRRKAKAAGTPAA